MKSTSELKAALARETYPVPVTTWEIEHGLDATGDDAVWVWVELETWTDLATRSAIREQIRRIISEQENGELDWVYVRFRDKAEHETV